MVNFTGIILAAMIGAVIGGGVGLVFGLIIIKFMGE